jgi:hypothetical protein
MPAKVEIQGLERILAKLEHPMPVTELRKFWTSAGILVRNSAVKKAPVDMGHLRASINSEVDTSPMPLFARAGFLNASPGSPLWFKARAMEYGTGRQGDKEVSHKDHHWPPGGALGLWAKRHGGASGYAVAAAIGKRGGLRPRPFLRPAFRESLGGIRELLIELGKNILAAWNRR